jgi:hypothetical protein
MGLETIAIGALVAGTATSAAGSIISGGEKSRAAQFESQQYAQQAQAAQTASIQDETQRRRQLLSSLETVMAMRTERGVGADSPTAMAIYDNGISMSEDDIQASKANYLAKADLAARASYLSQRKASTSLFAGYLGAASTIADAGFKGATLYTPRTNATLLDLLRTDTNHGPIRSPF